MSFSTNVPNASQSPGLFPAQIQTNWTRLKTIISQDHIFNDTANSATDGIHKKVSFQTRNVINPAKPSGAASSLYTRNDGSGIPQLRFYNGTEYTLTPATAPAVTVLAAVNFNGTGADGAKTIRDSYGVSSVVQTTTPQLPISNTYITYEIFFSPALPDINYIVSISAMRQSSSPYRTIFGQVATNSSYADSVKTGSLLVRFTSDSGEAQAPLMASVVIHGIT